MATSDGGVILPGSFPVDPSDPAKGNITPVMNAQQLTAVSMQMAAQLQGAQEALMGLAEHVRAAIADAAELLESVAVVITSVPMLDAPDDVDEAYQSLVTYVAGRREAKAQAEAAYQAWLAENPPEEDEPQVGFLSETELNDSEAAADDATWD